MSFCGKLGKREVQGHLNGNCLKFQKTEGNEESIMGFGGRGKGWYALTSSALWGDFGGHQSPKKKRKKHELLKLVGPGRRFSR